MNYERCPIEISIVTTHGAEQDFIVESYAALQAVNSAVSNPSYGIADPEEALQTHFCLHRDMPLSMPLEYGEGMVHVDLLHVIALHVRVLEPNA